MDLITKTKINKEIAPKLKEQLKLKNIMSVPRITKVVINMGCGDASSNSKIIEEAMHELELISGQKPVSIKAKNSIASFKLREGSPIGVKVTLRGKKMHNFLTKLINIALPRTRDFQGINPNSFDQQGNLSIGIKEQIIFPEIEFDKVSKIRGMDITICMTGDSKEKSYALLKAIGIPFASRKGVNNG